MPETGSERYEESFHLGRTPGGDERSVSFGCDDFNADEQRGIDHRQHQQTPERR